MSQCLSLRESVHGVRSLKSEVFEVCVVRLESEVLVSLYSGYEISQIFVGHVLMFESEVFSGLYSRCEVSELFEGLYQRFHVKYLGAYVQSLRCLNF